MVEYFIQHLGNFRSRFCMKGLASKMVTMLNIRTFDRSWVLHGGLDSVNILAY